MTIYGLTEYHIEQPDELFMNLKDAEDALASSRGVVVMFEVKSEPLMLLSKDYDKPMEFYCKCGANSEREYCEWCHETRGGEA